MRLSHILFSLIIFSFGYVLSVGSSGCAQIGAPTGGPKDSIPPKLLGASPKLKSTEVTGNKIVLTFDEYVELKDAQNNVLISPYAKKTPSVDYKLKTVTVRLKDSLLPNTTYSINFGNAIVDVNEGNPLKDFTYVFSTGKNIDSFTLSGKVLLAETDKTDSTIIAMLYRSTVDTVVTVDKPDYVARLSGDGSFTFTSLPAGTFKVYALKDGDGGKTYNSKKELFAFLDSAVVVSENTTAVTLYTFVAEKDKEKPAPPASNVKNLRYTHALGGGQQDITKPFVLSFTSPLKKYEADKISLADSSNNAIKPDKIKLDSSRTKITFSPAWQMGMRYRLILQSDALSDSSDKELAKNDTLFFSTKTEADYGNLILRFTNLDITRNPVLQFVQNDQIKESYPLTGKEWSYNRMLPGDYEVRILWDTNKNGIWDTGNYELKLQPEKVTTLPQKLAIKANWDNERDIKL